MKVNNNKLRTDKESIIKEIEKGTLGIEKKLLSIYKESLDKISVKFDRYSNKIIKEGLTVNNISALQRLRNLYTDIANEMKKIDPKVYNLISKNTQDSYKRSFYKNWFNLEKGLEMSLSFNRLNSKKVNAIVRNPFPGTSLDKLIVTIKQKAFNPVKFNLAIGQALGQGPKEIAKEILKAGDIFKQEYSNASFMALRIARTESLRAANTANLEFTKEANDMGIKSQKRWVATLDDRTRIDHRKMDGQIADEEGYFHFPDGNKTLAPLKSGIPEQDINCRCTYTDFIEGLSPDLQEIRDNEDQMMVVDGEQIKYSALHYEQWKAGKGITNE